jgi:hypothetical protein
MLRFVEIGEGEGSNGMESVPLMSCILYMFY